MVKNLFEHFKVLYQNILDKNPTLAAEHALKQEQEVYEKVNKLTYRNVCVRVLGPLPLLTRSSLSGCHHLHCVHQSTTAARLGLS